mmetsp:Transcript_96997/g.301936  ORF Transcript_96997/g.301936 Transcript_96997/m.301936 type:complete len:218 (+) Transcript_96997:808-1461(+)
MPPRPSPAPTSSPSGGSSTSSWPAELPSRACARRLSRRRPGRATRRASFGTWAGPCRWRAPRSARARCASRRRGARTCAGSTARLRPGSCRASRSGCRRWSWRALSGGRSPTPAWPVPCAPSVRPSPAAQRLVQACPGPGTQGRRHMRPPLPGRMPRKGRGRSRSRPSRCAHSCLRSRARRPSCCSKSCISGTTPSRRAPAVGTTPPLRTSPASAGS